MRNAVDHLGSAVALNPESADAYYHLAVALLQAGPTRDLDACISAAKHAVELESNEIRYWHLLGLALSATGEFKQALEIFGIGEAVEPDEDSVDPSVDLPPTETDTSTSSAASVPSGTAFTDTNSAGMRSESPQGLQTLLPLSASKAPAATTMLLTTPDHPPSSKEDIFEYGLQLRITILAVVELIDGAETASGRWVDVFAWFAERGGWIQPTEDR
jgi:tetratricopeptide (TPR) repeat protein